MDKIGVLFGKTVRAREDGDVLEITDGHTITRITQPWLASAVMRTFRATGDGALGDLGFPAAQPAAPMVIEVAPSPPVAAQEPTAPPPPVDPDRADHPGQPPASKTDWEGVLATAAATAPAAAPPLPIEGETVVDYAARVLADTGVTLASAAKADEGFARALLDTMRTRALTAEWGEFLTALAALIPNASPPTTPAESSSSAALS